MFDIVFKRQFALLIYPIYFAINRLNINERPCICRNKAQKHREIYPNVLIDKNESPEELLLICYLIRLLMPVHPQGRLLFMRGCLHLRITALTRKNKCVCAIDRYIQYYYFRKTYFNTRVYSLSNRHIHSCNNLKQYIISVIKQKNIIGNWRIYFFMQKVI